ncbi:MAG: putative transposase [Desulfobacteraceae bacterium Eth-SRB2]|nr:MAG: putative transposase [Desulfobacteraceae bacterium Eth-SRB2]
MRYRRARTKGGTYFFTVVTFKREKIFAQPANILLLRESFRYVMEKHCFKIDAFVLLPEHLHCIWTLPEGDRAFSKRWRLIKSYFTRKCDVKDKNKPHEARIRKQEQAVWQRRFWEHLIRDEKDFTNHVDYIHYNPVKHGLVKTPKDWEYSSFHRYVREGKYNVNWGAGQDMDLDSSVGKE